MPEYIHGSTDPREVARLEKQARFFAPHFHPHLRARAGQRILDLATGVGATAAELARAFPGVELVAVDLSRSQLQVARARHGIAAYVQGDGAHLPFRDGAFDRVHCSWLLEHVPSPLDVLREVRRVLAPQGEALFVEVDNSSFRTTPPLPEASEIMRALSEAQQRAGGDPYVGQKLEGLFGEAGFSKVEVWPVVLRGHAGDPALFWGVAEEFAEIFESVDEALGPEMTPKIRRAAAALRALPGTPGAEVYYRSFAARGTR